MRVMVWGGSGLVGSACLRYLLKDDRVTEVIAPTRRPLALSHGKLSNPQVDFARIATLGSLFEGVDCVVSALGTTLRQAGSRENFRRIDHDYNLAIAQAARAGGVGRYCLVSAVGADEQSLIFYSRIKGELERRVIGLGFPSLFLYRPGLLVGEREHFRLGESLAIKTSGLMNLLMQGPLKPFRAIRGEVVGRALANHAAASDASEGTHFLYYPEIVSMSGQSA